MTKIIEEVSVRQRLATLRHLAENQLVERLNLPTCEWIMLRADQARSFSNGVNEEVFVYYVDGHYWVGTQGQLDGELSWGTSPEVIFTYIHGRLMDTTGDRPGDRHVGIVG